MSNEQSKQPYESYGGYTKHILVVTMLLEDAKASDNLVWHTFQPLGS